MVRGEQQRPAGGEVLAADPLQAEVDEEERHEEGSDQPVEPGAHAAIQSAIAEGPEVGLRLSRALVRPRGGRLLGDPLVHACNTPSATASLQWGLSPIAPE